MNYVNVVFSSLPGSLKQAFNNIPDTRHPEKIEYSMSDIYSCGFALFFLQDKSVLEFQRRFQKETSRNNLSTVFNIKSLPSDTQLRDIIDIHSYNPIKGVFKEYFHRMQRGKYLSQYLFSIHIILLQLTDPGTLLQNQ
ncbi:MAG: hypothetical protein JXB88_04930 [Spirochaetales bacterium]|nr:hypothetical protein [Spirochaetales bacterium]